MKCNNVKIEIEKWIFEHDYELPTNVNLHIENCASCSSYFEKSKEQKALMLNLQQQQPQIPDPAKLTSNILQSINNENNSDSTNGKNKGIIRNLHFVRRFLAAASISLIVIFAYEQYVAVDKIIKLEEKVSRSANNVHYSKNVKNVLKLYPKENIETLKYELFLKARTNKSNLRTRIILARLDKKELAKFKLQKANPDSKEKTKGEK